MAKKGEIKDKTGEKFITNEGYIVTILNYRGACDIDLQFEDGTIIKNRAYNDVKRGQVKNPYHKSVLSIGFLGVGKYNNRTHIKIYDAWLNMLERCYSNNSRKKFPTYKDVTVDERWHNFQVFAEWFEQNYKENCALDKDILIKGNKIYSPETCCFVPQEVNKLFVKRNSKRGEHPIGVSHFRNKFQACLNIKGKKLHLGTFNTPEEAFQTYKIAKENYIKEIAEKYKNQITEATYRALINYKVEITD